jgi:hypothetical protein
MLASVTKNIGWIGLKLKEPIINHNTKYIMAISDIRSTNASAKEEESLSCR